MITSEQIHEKEFSYKMRGYNDAEVDEYLDQLAAFIDNMAKENKDLRDRLKNTADQLTYMKTLESTLRDTLITAQRSAEETTHNASLRAEGIIRTANEESEKIIARANEEAEAIRRQLTALKQQAAVYRTNFKMLLGAQMQLLEDSGIGKEVVATQVQQMARAHTGQRTTPMMRIDLAAREEKEERTAFEEQPTVRQPLQDRPLAARRIVPIIEEDE